MPQRRCLYGWTRCQRRQLFLAAWSPCARHCQARASAPVTISAYFAAPRNWREADPRRRPPAVPGSHVELVRRISPKTGTCHRGTHGVVASRTARPSCHQEPEKLISWYFAQGVASLADASAADFARPTNRPRSMPHEDTPADVCDPGRLQPREDIRVGMRQVPWVRPGGTSSEVWRRSLLAVARNTRASRASHRP
jgi:hypothetical protein